jgi:hypothetical protein
MTQWSNLLRLRSLRVQVLLWTVLPLTILLIVSSLTGIGTHQSSMHQLALDENRRLVSVMAHALSLQLADTPFHQASLDTLLHIDSDGHETQVLLVDKDGQILFASDKTPTIASVNLPGSAHPGESIQKIDGTLYIVVPGS